MFTLSSYIPSLLIEPIVVFPIRFRYNITITALKGPVEVLLEAYKDYIDIFNKKEARLLPDYSLYKLVIKLIKGKQPLFGPLYSLLKAKLKVLREYLDKNLQRR